MVIFKRIIYQGCPFRCTFCGLNEMHELSNLRYADPALVYEHLKRIKEEMSITAINFREEFRKLEIEFRQWMRDNVKLKGGLQDYEVKLYNS